MYAILFLALTSFVLCYVLTPAVGHVSLLRGIVDMPDNRRKLHTQPTPHTGGIAVALAYVFPIAMLLLSPLNAASSVDVPLALRLLPATLIMFVLGLSDDARDLGPWTKLVVQTMAAVLAYSAGVRVNVVAPGPVDTDMTRALDDTLDDIQRTLPAGMQIDRQVFRQADFIERALGNLRAALLEGGLLVIAVGLALRVYRRKLA